MMLKLKFLLEKQKLVNKGSTLILKIKWMLTKMLNNLLKILPKIMKKSVITILALED